MRYVALDTETSGLDPQKHDLLEVGAIYDDLKLAYIPKQDPFHAVIIPYGDFLICPVVAKMHQRLWDLMEKVDKEELDYQGWYLDEGIAFCRPEALVDAFEKWLQSNGFDNKITIAAKNPNFDREALYSVDRFKKRIRIRYRMIDPMHYFIRRTDDVPPNLTECMKRAGEQIQNLHSAVDDAWAVAKLMRHAFKTEQARVLVD